MRAKKKISFINHEIKFALSDKEKLRGWIEHCLKDYRKQTGVITFIFCSDKYLLAINKQFLKHDTLTDIITFNYTEGKTVSGEVYISTDRVKDNAKLFCVSFKNELHRVMIHGVLHLCGHKDKISSAKKEMTGKEDYYLSLRSF